MAFEENNEFDDQTILSWLQRNIDNELEGKPRVPLNRIQESAILFRFMQMRTRLMALEGTKRIG